MFYKVITLLAIIALTQAKPTGKFASFGTSQKHDIHEEDSEPKQSARFSRYSLPAGNVVQTQGGDYNEPKANKHYVDTRPNVEYNPYDDEDYNGHPKYKYTYSVNDENTGDYKSHFEERDGDTVHGEYVVADPDGTVRKVTYTADSKNGFQAVVKTTKNNSPSYESPQAPTYEQQQPEYYQHKRAENIYTRPQKAIPTETNYKSYHKQSSAESNYKSYTNQPPVESNFKSPAESNYKSYINQSPAESNHKSYINPIPVESNYKSRAESNYKSYINQPPAESNHKSYVNQPPAEASYKSYINQSPPETHYKPYVKQPATESNFKPSDTNYKKYLQPAIQQRHHNLVTELKYHDRLNNHRMSGPGYESGEDYSLGKGKDSGGGRYIFRQKSQKDSHGSGSEAVASYASPEIENDDDEEIAYRFFEE